MASADLLVLRAPAKPPGALTCYATYALENEPEVLAGDDLARGQHDREPPLGAACGSRRGGLDIEIPLLRADRVAAGRKTGEGIVPVGIRLNRRNGRAGEIGRASCRERV